MPHRFTPEETLTFARSLRTGQTDAERKLWRILRGRRLAALKWRCQVPIGRYIVDFVCFEKRLIVECGGSQHARSSRDHERDAWLVGQDFIVVRFCNHEILRTPRVVEDTILARAGLPL